MTQSAHQIAAGLNPFQAAALKRAEADGAGAKFYVRSWHCNARTIKAIRRKALGADVYAGLVLTPLGLEVRAILMDAAGL